MDSVVPGAVAAFVVDCSIFPLDTIKTRYQATDYATRFPQGKGLTKGLWQGFGPVVFATLPSAALFFTVYENAKRAYTSPSLPILGVYTSTGKGKHIANAAASASAELASCLILAPAETLKQRRQVEVPTAGGSGRSLSQSVVGTARAFKATFTEPAQLRNLWKGYLALAGRNLPQTAIQLPIWEKTRSVLSKRFEIDVWSREEGGAESSGSPVRQDDKNHRQRPVARPGGQDLPAGHYGRVWLVSGGSAAFAGAVASAFTTPLDVAKTRIMLRKAGEGRQHGALSVMATILREEGVRALWRGGAMRCAWIALGGSIYFGSYDTAREYFKQVESHSS